MQLQKVHIITISIAIILSSCVRAGKDDTGTEYAPNMYHAIPYEPLKQIDNKSAGDWVNSSEDEVGEYYSSNPNNPFGMNMREPVPNTVPRNDQGYLPYRIHKDSLQLAAKVKSPLPASVEIVSEGKILYTRFCNHCHGETGQGDGLVGQVIKGVPAYNSRSVKDKSEGHIFHVITQGIRRMGAHGSQLSVDERWKIVRYVQTLQNL